MEALIFEALKETVKQSILDGAKAFDVFKFVVEKFGNEIARLVAIDLALDLGLTGEAMACFNKLAA